MARVARSTFASRSYRDDAVVLRTYKLGEADRIVILLSAEHGQVRAVAKGVRRTTSRFGARLEPFNVAEVQLVHGRALDIVSQAIGKRSYGERIASDYESYTAAAAMAETAEKLTADDHDTSSQHYRLLVGALSAVARGLHEPGRILDSYLLRAVSLAGWTPSFVDRARPRRATPRSSCWTVCCAVTGPPSTPPIPGRRVRRPGSWPPTSSGTWSAPCEPWLSWSEREPGTQHRRPPQTADPHGVGRARS